MTKKELRNDIIKKRQMITEDVKLNTPKLIFEKLITMPEFYNANAISSFVSFRDELEMQSINDWIIKQNKTLLLPYIDPTLKRMVFYKVDDLSQLQRNHFGILEPNPAIHMLYENLKIECVLTPGVAFDRQGYRLGYGGGFYDAFFADIKKTTPKIGVAFEMQVVEMLPVESYDQPISHLITEIGMRCFAL